MAKSSELGMSHLREVPSAHRIQCVYLTCFRPEFSILAITLQYSAIRLHRAETLEEADFLLTVTGSTVLLSDVTFLDGSWQDALSMAQEVHPVVACSIVAEPLDWPFLENAYARGACATLTKPVDFIRAIQLIRTLHEAARDRMCVLRDVSAGTAALGLPSTHCR
jgi:DNA-binding NtrC family response regulator